MNEFERERMLETLGLSHDALEQVALRTHQWGRAIVNLLEQRESEDIAPPLRTPSAEALRSEAASLFTIAGSYRMLLSPDLARESMRQAAMHLTANGSTFAYPVAICAAEPGVAERALQSPGLTLRASDRANTLLALGWMDVIEGARQRDRGPLARGLLREHLELAQPAGQAEVGRMQIPLEAIVRVIDAADRVVHAEGNPAVLLRHVHDVLVRMHDVTAAAMADRYHWKMLMSSVLPVEPEAVVLGGLIMGAVTITEYEEEILQRMELPPQALVPLQVGKELVEQAL